MWPLDHSVLSSLYTLLMVRVHDAPIYIKLLGTSPFGERGQSVDSVLFFSIQCPLYHEMSMPSAMILPLCWCFGRSLLCFSVSTSTHTQGNPAFNVAEL